MRMRRAMLFALIATAVAPALPAAADIGKSPAGAKGTVVSFEGGYLYQDAPSVNGYGVTTTPGGPIRDVTVSPDDGYFLGGLIGYDNGTPFVGGFHRIEFYLLYDRADDSASDSVPPLADIVLKSVDGEVLITTGGLRGKTSVERETWEWGFRLEDDDIINPTTTVTWVISPFIRGVDEDTDTTVNGCCLLARTASVDSLLYGVYVAAEPETWFTSTIALVGRVGAGIYGYDSDGNFSSAATVVPDPFAAKVSDSASGVGFRGLLGIGLKFRLSANANLETFGEADYFSDVGTANIVNNQPTNSYVSHVDTDDLFEVRTGARITIGFGPAN